jgi:hypothetical protein
MFNVIAKRRISAEAISTMDRKIASSSKGRSPRNDRGHMKATIDRLEDSEYISEVNKS